jgi:pyridinium-3,5-biscarboxylic acid mononucleotide synthase
MISGHGHSLSETHLPEATAETARILWEDKNNPFARIDISRTRRRGFPEAVFCPGKTREQVLEILTAQFDAGATPVLATRVDPMMAEFVIERLPQARHNALARILVLGDLVPLVHKGVIHVVSAGTADIPVAEEVAVVAECLGNIVERTWDVGVAGLHRLLDRIDHIRQANVLVVVAGMEGALASVLSGLTHQVVVAVPTSVGYGSSFEGLSALLSMLNTCSPGVAVVNIDNGYGAACLASMINRSMATK